MKLCLSPETEPRQNNNQLGKQKEEPLQGFAGTSEKTIEVCLSRSTRTLVNAENIRGMPIGISRLARTSTIARQKRNEYMNRAGMLPHYLPLYKKK